MESNSLYSRYFGGKETQTRGRGDVLRGGRRERMREGQVGFKEPSWSRELWPWFKDWWPQHTADDNIYAPERSWIGNIFGGGKITFITQNYNMWNVFEDITRSMPGYISMVLPYDYRATMYFGPPDWTYKYTARKDTAWDKIFRDNERTNDEIIGDLLKQGLIREVTKDSPEMKKTINYLNKHLNRSYQNNPNQYTRSSMRYIAQMIDRDGKYVVPSYGVLRVKNGLVTDLMSDLREDSPEDYETKQSLEFVKRVIDRRNNRDFAVRGMPKSSEATRSVPNKNITRIQPTEPFYIEMVGNDEKYYTDKSGSIYTSQDIVDDHNKTRINYFSNPINRPDRKLVRNYYFKDSFHHIVMNNIVASSRYMYNEVTVEWAKNREWISGKKLRKTPANKAKTKVRADDTIWPEKIKEIIVLEKNARNRIDSWLYGLSDLWLGMREMYQGELVILGDGSIKPYDFVYIYDDYNQMYGAVEVEQVVHRFDQDTGFTTTIKPDLICFVNNSIEEGKAMLAANYLPGYARYLVVGGILGTPAVRYAAQDNLTVEEEESLWHKIKTGLRMPFQGLLYKLSPLQVGRREPIGLMPLLYNGNPYLAGIEGFRKDDLLQAVGARLERFGTKHQEGWESLQEDINTWGHRWLFK